MHWVKHHSHHRFNRQFLFKLVLVLIFLFFAYKYYSDNIMDAFFTELIQLPFIHKIVESWIYWVIVAVICWGIWKLVDYFN